jgi:hypothetical protein
VSTQRDNETAFFKFAWQTLLSGIKPVVGLDKKKQEETAAMVSQMAVDKQNRQVKKQLRIQRREDRRKKREEKLLQKGEN